MTFGKWLAIDRGLRETAPDHQRGLDEAARLRQSHRMATIRPVRVTFAPAASIGPSSLPGLRHSGFCLPQNDTES